MPGALFPRIKTWAKEKLFYQDENGEFDNILSHFIANYMQGWSSTVAQMKIQTDPGSQGSESLALSVSDEIERLRFEMARVIGSTYHYDTPPISLTGLNSVFSQGVTPISRIASGRVDANNQPMALQASGAAATVKILGATTNLVYFVNNTSYTLNSNITSSALTTAPTSGNTDTLALDVAQFDTAISLTAGTITMTIGQVYAFKLGSEYFLGECGSSTVLNYCVRGIFFNSTDTSNVAASALAGATVTLMKLAWIFIDTAQAIAFTYTNPVYSSTAPTSPAVGDYWFKFSDYKWYSYNGSTWVATNSVLVGFCIQDATNCVVSRTMDYYKGYSDLNTVELELLSTTQIQTIGNGCQVSTYGNTYTVQIPGRMIWDSVQQIDTGAIGASKNYYVYVKDTGVLVYSLMHPIDRRYDLRGYYHPSKPWRAVGGFTSTAGSLMQIPFYYANARPRGNWAVSNSSGAFTVVSAAFADVTNLTATLPTSNRPVYCTLSSDTTGSAFIETKAGSVMIISLVRDTTTIASWRLDPGSGAVPSFNIGNISFLDQFPGDGTHVYKIQAKSTAGADIINNVILKVIEWS